MFFIYAGLSLLLLAGCSVDKDNMIETNTMKESKNTTNNANAMETENSKDISFEDNMDNRDISFPVPQNIYKVLNYSYNKIYLLSKDSQSVLDYYKELEINKWIIMKPKTETSPYSTYINEKQALVIKEQEIKDNVIEMEITFYQGKEPSENTRDFNSIIKNSLDYENIYYILEYDIEDATKALGLYGFYVFTDKIEPTKLVVDKYDHITKINYDQYLIYDIDSDGKDEFLTKLGYGFGRYIITFSAWKYNDAEKKLVLSNRTKFEQLEEMDMFLIQTENGVEVLAGVTTNGDLEKQQSYGRLLIENDMLLPEKRDIPFKLLEE
ncbi:hypothetical protein [Lacrimispora sp.]|uniref:hypothetical protein n=1 Tax=Lacrimispora sp. TaxID=2719234 RepID=UPI00345FA27C